MPEDLRWETPMREELERALFVRWPGWFDIQGFEHGDGWFDILWRLCVDLEPLAEGLEGEGNPPFEVVRVREEGGGLHVYVNGGTDAICERIEAAQEESLRICEVCGRSGLRRRKHWTRIRCDEHAEE